MKTFKQFIIEARNTIAFQQATQMGLVSSGHGDYYDSQGKLVAKTVGGKLQVFKGRQQKQQEQPQIQQTSQSQQPPQQVISQDQTQDQSQTQEQPKGVVITIGRFNPPAKNDEQLLKYGFARAKENGFEYRVYPSRVQDKGTNPLNPSLKIQYMQMMFPDYADYILDSEDMRTIFDILGSLYNDGFSDVRIVVGSERLGEFQSLVHRNQGQGYEFENIEVMAASVRDPDSDTGGSGSSAALRTAAAQGNYEAFISNLPTRMKREEKEQLFNSVLKSMKLEENYELWRIAPDLDREGLRVNYKQNNLYPVGSLVENINTGLRGRVMRRGTNYLICVTNEGTMFKSWLSAVHLPEDVYEVGTDKYRKKLQRITPGQPVVSYSNVKIKETIPKNINILRQRLQKNK
jgi:hypothetical protein